jgi:hypothetical protein
MSVLIVKLLRFLLPLGFAGRGGAGTHVCSFFLLALARLVAA